MAKPSASPALRLVRSENVGPVTFRELMNHYGSAEAALAAVPELSRRGGYRRAIRLCPAEDAEAELERARSNGAQPLFVGEPQYPAPLAALDAPPPMLYVKGDIGLLQRPTIAIVGARQCSAAGAKLARQFASEIGRAGFVVASGLARGIDAMAHQAALDTGTVAVLAGGIDDRLPARARRAAARNRRARLPRQRDAGRLYAARAGLSAPQPHRLGPVAGRAHRRGGAPLGQPGHRAARGRAGPRGVRHSRPSARSTRRGHQQASEVGRHAGDRARGCSGRADAADARPARVSSREEPEEPHRDGPALVSERDRDRIVAALGPAPVDIDSLVRGTGLSIRSVQIALMELSLAGRIERHGGGLVSLAPVP